MSNLHHVKLVHDYAHVSRSPATSVAAHAVGRRVYHKSLELLVCLSVLATAFYPIFSHRTLPNTRLPPKSTVPTACAGLGDQCFSLSLIVPTAERQIANV